MQQYILKSFVTKWSFQGKLLSKATLRYLYSIFAIVSQWVFTFYLVELYNFRKGFESSFYLQLMAHSYNFNSQSKTVPFFTRAFKTTCLMSSRPTDTELSYLFGGCEYWENLIIGTCQHLNNLCIPKMFYSVEKSISR